MVAGKRIRIGYEVEDVICEGEGKKAKVEEEESEAEEEEEEEEEDEDEEDEDEEDEDEEDEDDDDDDDEEDEYSESRFYLLMRGVQPLRLLEAVEEDDTVADAYCFVKMMSWLGLEPSEAVVGAMTDVVFKAYDTEVAESPTQFTGLFKAYKAVCDTGAHYDSQYEDEIEGFTAKWKRNVL